MDLDQSEHLYQSNFIMKSGSKKCCWSWASNREFFHRRSDDWSRLVKMDRIEITLDRMELLLWILVAFHVLGLLLGLVGIFLINKILDKLSNLAPADNVEATGKVEAIDLNKIKPEVSDQTKVLSEIQESIAKLKTSVDKTANILSLVP